MRKFFRYLFQYAILAAFGYFIYQTAFRRETPPVHDRAAWTQREGFVAISYGGVTIDERTRSLVTKKRLREQFETLANAAMGDAPGPSASTHPDPTPPADAAAQPGPTLVELRAFVAERSSPENRPKIKAILESFGVKKLTELPDRHYAALKANVDAL